MSAHCKKVVIALFFIVAFTAGAESLLYAAGDGGAEPGM